jgi:hypothetical protein
MVANCLSALPYRHPQKRRREQRQQHGQQRHIFDFRLFLLK